LKSTTDNLETPFHYQKVILYFIMAAQSPISESGSQATHIETPKDPYKYQWSRYDARERLNGDEQRAKDKLANLMADAQKPEDNEIERVDLDTISVDVSNLFEEVKKKVEFIGLVPPRHGHFKVGIVGAGVAGLFAGLALDWINEIIERHTGIGYLKIDYEILEAASEDRFGGRLYTHCFNKDGTHGYYDVGPCAFPITTS
jgi:hypothetical protein